MNNSIINGLTQKLDVCDQIQSFLFSSDELADCVSETKKAEWIDDEVVTFIEQLLRRTVRDLVDPRTSLPVLKESFYWLMNDEISVLSFRHCALQCQVNYEDLRELVLEKVSKRGDLNEIFAS